MVTRERTDERGDELQELRERYNRLCAALAFGGGASSADRLLQEIHVLTQRIVAVEARQARSEEVSAPAMPLVTESSQPAHSPNRTSNVIAFRVKMKGTADQRPGYLPDFTRASTRDNALPPAPMTSPSAPAAATPSPLEELRSAVVAQGQAILVVSARCDKQHARLSEVEERLPAAVAGSDLTAEVAALRHETENQRQQLVVLATAVHRLARLLASESTPE